MDLTWLSTVDHKKIGLMYPWARCFLFFGVGGLEALLIRLQLARAARGTFLDPAAYNQSSRCTARP